MYGSEEKTEKVLQLLIREWHLAAKKRNFADCPRGRAICFIEYFAQFHKLMTSSNRIK